MLILKVKTNLKKYNFSVFLIEKHRALYYQTQTNPLVKFYLLRFFLTRS
jgi:hypothetical protein